MTYEKYTLEDAESRIFQLTDKLAELDRQDMSQIFSLIDVQEFIEENKTQLDYENQTMGGDFGLRSALMEADGIFKETVANESVLAAGVVAGMVAAVTLIIGQLLILPLKIVQAVLDFFSKLFGIERKKSDKKDGGSKEINSKKNFDQKFRLYTGKKVKEEEGVKNIKLNRNALGIYLVNNTDMEFHSLFEGSRFGKSLLDRCEVKGNDISDVTSAVESAGKDAKDIESIHASIIAKLKDNKVDEVNRIVSGRKGTLTSAINAIAKSTQCKLDTTEEDGSKIYKLYGKDAKENTSHVWIKIPSNNGTITFGGSAKPAAAELKDPLKEYDGEEGVVVSVKFSDGSAYKSELEDQEKNLASSNFKKSMDSAKKEVNKQIKDAESTKDDLVKNLQALKDKKDVKNKATAALKAATMYTLAPNRIISEILKIKAIEYKSLTDLDIREQIMKEWTSWAAKQTAEAE